MTTTQYEIDKQQAEQAAYAEEVLRSMVGPEQARSTINYLIKWHMCTDSCHPFRGYGTCF